MVNGVKGFSNILKDVTDRTPSVCQQLNPFNQISVEWCVLNPSYVAWAVGAD